MRDTGAIDVDRYAFVIWGDWMMYEEACLAREDAMVAMVVEAIRGDMLMARTLREFREMGRGG
jgi:hypothetical protein